MRNAIAKEHVLVVMLACLAGCSVGVEDAGMDDWEAEEVGTIEAPLTQAQRETKIQAKFTANQALLGSALGGYQHFGNGARRDFTGAGNNSSIYIGDAVNRAHIVLGFIRSKYLSKTSVLGFPTTDEGNTRFGTGKYNFFEFGRILWKSGSTEARETHGGIDDLYEQLALEWGNLGYPTSDEYTSSGRQKNDFEFGKVYWKSSIGAWPLLTAHNGNSQIVSANWTRLQNVSLRAQATSGNACLSADGVAFPPGKTVQVMTADPQGLRSSSNTATVRSDGTFSYREGTFCTSGIRTVDGAVTIFARTTDGSAAAATRIFYNDGLPGGAL